TTYSTGASTRSYVVNRLLQLRHSRRRRTASPVSESLESTTFESDAPQKGHFKVQAVQAAEGKEPPSIATQRTAVREERAEAATQPFGGNERLATNAGLGERRVYPDRRH